MCFIPTPLPLHRRNTAVFFPTYPFIKFSDFFFLFVKDDFNVFSQVFQSSSLNYDKFNNEIYSH